MKFIRSLLVVGVLSITVLGCKGGTTSKSDAAQGSSQSEAENAKHNYNYPISGDPTDLDPIEANSLLRATITGQLFRGLIRSNSDLEVVPDLALDLPTSEDGGQTYKFTLRSGIKFHNGREITAKDVAYTIDRILRDPVSKFSGWLASIQGAHEILEVRGSAMKEIAGYEEKKEQLLADTEENDVDHKSEIESLDEQIDTVWGRFTAETATMELTGVKVLSDTELEIALLEPSSWFLVQFAHPAFGIVPSEEVARLGGDFGHYPVGSGPYQLTTWEPNDKIVLELSPHYISQKHDGSKPDITSITYRVETETLKLRTEFAAGRLDHVFIDGEQAQNLLNPETIRSHVSDVNWAKVVSENKSAIQFLDFDKLNSTIQAIPDGQGKSFQFLTRTSAVGSYLFMNCEHGKLALGKEGSSKREKSMLLREAIFSAVDRNYFASEVRKGMMTVMDTLIPPGLFPWVDNANIEATSPFKIEYNSEVAAKLVNQVEQRWGAKALALTLITDSRPHMQESATTIQSDLNRVGFKVEIKTADPQTSIGLIESGKAGDLYVMGWAQDYPDPDNWMGVMFDQANVGGAGNFGRYQSAEVSDLLTQARHEVDQAKRGLLYAQAQELILADRAVLPLGSGRVAFGVQNRFTNFAISPSDAGFIMFTPFEEIELKVVDGSGVLQE